MKQKSLFLFFFSILIVAHTKAQTTNSFKTTGPEKGTLMIVGGGSKSDSIFLAFIKLAGGMNAPIVVIPTADGNEKHDQNSGGAGTFRKLGATNVTVLHTYDKNVANTDSFVQPLLKAKAVWFGGGRQWRLVDAYANTLTEKLLWKLLERDGLIGGTSAGASIQGSFLTRGDSKNNQIMMGDHQVGFGFVKNIAIDQHVLARNRQFDLFEILKNRPELLGIGLDENMAIIVRGNQFEVLGNTYVLIYDTNFWSSEGSDLKNLPDKNKLFYFLRNGDKYDLYNRKVIK
ncbi:MAG: cyanophycinase [Sphingobacteriia bacterium]|jgi:cyanophycinase